MEIYNNCAEINNQRQALLMKKQRLGKDALMMVFLPIYVIMFIVAEKLITADYWVSWCILDDYIPFVKEFVFIYVLWYPLMIGFALWLLWKDRRAFRRYGWATIIGLTSCVVIFFILPSGQDLRPELTGTDIASNVLRGIYSADTNTNVLPSMHVVGSLAAMCAAFDTDSIKKKWLRWGICILSILINASTVLIKQHSILDIFAGIALFAIIFPFVYIIPEKRRKKKASQ